MKTVERGNTERARRYFEDKLTFTTGPVELSKAMKEGTVVVVDVRAAKDFDQEHIVGSINLPEDEWSSERGLDHDKRVAVLCYSQVCHLAARAAVEFLRRGYSVIELEGGFPAWKSHGLPTEANDVSGHEVIDRTRAYLESRRAAEHDAAQPQIAEPKAVPEANAGPDAKAVPEPEAKTASEQKAAPESKAEPESKAAPEASAAPEANAASETNAAPEAKPLPEPKAAPGENPAPEAKGAPVANAAPQAHAPGGAASAIVEPDSRPEPKAAAPKTTEPLGQTSKPGSENQPRSRNADGTHRSP